MSETKHTPGPWTVDADPEASELLSVWFDEGGTGAEIAGRIVEPANAALIAAAPDLLSMLKETLREADARISFFDMEWGAQADKARALIAKAEGRWR